ncbi:MAG TPA: zinc finger domain-containing protein [Candidatus Izemoplasmatales bacterium]|nr:zinc finger domain-containing protein [Bacillota bacterium]HRY77786.1 zinc finger domain-containing protein [Candidatus Izemoplasmatales bacterium]
MIELPESHALALEANRLFTGKTIAGAEAGTTPHKFAWFFQDPADYSGRLVGRVFSHAEAHGGLLDLYWENSVLTFGDGIRLRYFSHSENAPERHQLRLDFSDGSGLIATVQMYGGLWCYPRNSFENPYHQVAQSKPSPFSSAFDWRYFEGLIGGPETAGLSAKAVLATGQRIPGLGNGCLQDILWEAGIHPKTKSGNLSSAEKQLLFGSVRSVLSRMREDGGRDTEFRMDGTPGGYKTILGPGKNGTPCPKCGSMIVKEAFLGGSIYFCPSCQPLRK